MTELRRDPLVSFIVPVYKVPKDQFKRCLMSLTEQDYDNKEVICVFDGVDPDLLSVAMTYSNKFSYVQIFEIPHGGACAARNAGFEKSKGEIVSFFNSDYIAKPGMTRLWVDSLLDNPDCGFAYGAYEYATMQRNTYWSKPFDVFQLAQANYIDCGFPLWRKYVVEWDPKVKSLQDWDFWIRVVKTHNVKGYYLGRDVSFIAALPRDGGLSNDSHNNWVERVRFIRKKNGIKESPLVVTSVGAPNHGVEIAKMLGADYRDDTIFKPHEYKALYMVGFYLKPGDHGNLHPQIMSAFQGKKRILHFVGADIHWLKSFSHKDLKMISYVINHGCEDVLCETELAKSELEEMGIIAKVVPIPPYSEYEVKPLPDKFSVAIYLSDKSDFDKYCQKETLSIVRALPHIQFNGYGDGAKDEAYPNFKHYGNMDRTAWKQFVYDNSCYLRMVRHDTRPMASDEFLMAGRRVITNVPGTYVDYIDTKGDIKSGEWDIFQVGLNDHNWSRTKKAIVQKILDILKNPMPDNLREVCSNELKTLLDKNKYKSTIYSMAGIIPCIEEVIYP